MYMRIKEVINSIMYILDYRIDILLMAI